MKSVANPSGSTRLKKDSPSVFGVRSVLEGIHPARGRAFIRHIETEDRYAGGRILIPDQARDKVAKQQFIIVSLGDYETCDSLEDCPLSHTKRGEHRHRLNVGDWVLCRNRSWQATPDQNIFVVRQAHILGVFREG